MAAPNATRLLVLGVVRFLQPVHGYDVRRELVSWRVDSWANVAPGSIYNALKSLTRDLFLEVVGTDQVGGRPERTQYRMTRDGETEFQNLLRETWWQVRQPIDPLMPALAFLPVMSKEELLSGLEHRVAQVQAACKQLDFSIDALPSGDVPAHVKELYRLSKARMLAEIDWGRALAERLRKGEYEISVGPPPPARGKRTRKSP